MARLPLAPLAPNAWLRWDVVRRRLPARRGRVLEIGCGQGGFGTRIAAGHDYTAVEIDGASWAAADARIRAVSPGARVLHGSLSALEPSETFDVVCAFEVIEHLEDDAGALAEWAGRVRPGGTLLLSTPAWQDRFGPWDTAAGHFRRYEPAALAGLLRGAGLDDAHVRVYGAPLGFLLEAVRDRTPAAIAATTGSGSLAERTSGSGRMFQPSTALTGSVNAVGTWPFRVLQRVPALRHGAGGLGPAAAEPVRGRDAMSSHGSPPSSPPSPPMRAAPPLTLYGSLRWDVVEARLPAAPGRVLEVGCGQGAAAVRLAARAAGYTGVELDDVSARTAEQRLADAGVPGAVVHGPLDSLPSAERFDLVCAFEVIEHIEDDAAALREWASRLRPGGMLLVSTPAWQSRYGPMDEAVGHFRRYDPPALAALLATAGLTDIGLRLYGMPLGYALEAARNQIARRRPGLREEGSTADRTARSGRLFQPTTATQGTLVRAATWPFRMAQRAFPQTGTGLVAWGSAPRTERPAG